MRSAPVRNLAVALAISCSSGLAVAQTPAPPPPAAEAPPPAAPTPPADAPMPPPPVMEVPPPPPPPPAVVVAVPAPPPPAAAGPLSVTTKLVSATLYGNLQADAIYDSTQSFNDLANNGVIIHTPAPTMAMPMPATPYGADHGRTTFSVRNSRVGFKLKGPDSDTFKTSGLVEWDFLGNQPQGSPTPTAPAGTTGISTVSEGSYFTSPTFRMRHYWVKLETPVLDIMAGQNWQLFGWQGNYHPNTIEYQGVPGQIYSRSPQFRLTKVIKSAPVNVEIAVAASRPPQRDSEVPDGQAGVRLVLNDWKGMHAAGQVGLAIDGASIGFSTVGRYLKIPNFATTTTSTTGVKGYGYSLDLLLPVIPASDVNHPDNALTLQASLVYGQAIADLYTGLTGGASTASLPKDANGNAQTYPQDLDNGLVVVDANGFYHAIRWYSALFGLQYFLPTPTRMWISANYSHMYSPDINTPGANPAKIFNKSDWADGNLFVEANAAVRFGLEYAYFHQHYVDGSKANNSRVQFAVFYIF
jgi:hypothetical protein